jgi:hypothetical protein
VTPAPNTAGERKDTRNREQIHGTNRLSDDLSEFVERSLAR